MAVATEERILATNRAAFHNYHISAKFEAGAALTGTEVKSVLEGRIQLKDSYVAVRDDEAWLFNAHIAPYSHGNRANHDPLRTRKLLLHRRELDRLDHVLEDRSGLVGPDGIDGGLRIGSVLSGTLQPVVGRQPCLTLGKHRQLGEPAWR